ncbi:protein of unknown function DUF81 [Methylocella silvestris BL2]|uniref:Probable membrane transporter protein n=1 Tax=Methylocella silvestris (strain DSM 15510 / CIP 108128 / LMG 27833 / NCIMB 13906 / BL2) TaxID=395965 RepID=B8EM30_METSB|nr:TSUP family transporter [Methylocella silvestris]ACK51419.1 protein of unknown function DUF81 [Methylocella silvestris BL2]
MSLTIFALLVATGFAAGFVDAIAGGGGLLTLPVLTLAGLDPVSAIATNKLQGSFGSGSAMRTYARAGHIRWSEVGLLAALAAAGAVAGAALVAHLPVDWLKAVLPVALVLIAVYFAFSPKISDLETHARMSVKAFTLTIIPLIGCYDGMFGPGAGSFYVLGFVELLGYGVVKATAHTKVANFSSNLAALATLAMTGHVWWILGLAMGVAQFFGARLGAHTAIRNGAALIRPLLVTICLLIAARLAWARM